jgi:hypothetical protein
VSVPKKKARAPVLDFPEPKAPWPERGSEDLTPEHQQYLLARGIKRAYWKVANFRSESDGLVIPYGKFNAGEFWPDFGRKRLIPARGDQKFTQPKGVRPAALLGSAHGDQA